MPAQSRHRGYLAIAVPVMVQQSQVRIGAGFFGPAVAVMNRQAGLRSSRRHEALDCVPYPLDLLWMKQEAA